MSPGAPTHTAGAFSLRKFVRLVMGADDEEEEEEEEQLPASCFKSD